ncbi:MAG: competence/damage-inducible protein A [Formosimonas sp.]
MNFGLMIIGDEILNGRYTDAHFAFAKQALLQRGLQLAWVEYVADVRSEIVARLQRSFAAGLPVLVTGGIGATPDDHTRQAAAQALGLELQMHEQAAHLINTVVAARVHETDLNSALHQQRLQMAFFPAGADLIPNPYNQVAGFSIRGHYFFPGFPEMAHPMMEWVLDNYYQSDVFKEAHAQQSAMIYNLQESQITPAMLSIEARFAGVQTFSLPKIGARYSIELGVKASGAASALVAAAWQDLQAQVRALGGAFDNVDKTCICPPD